MDYISGYYCTLIVLIIGSIPMKESWQESGHDEKSCWCQDVENAKLKVCSQINEYPPPCESARHFTLSLVLSCVKTLFAL